MKVNYCLVLVCALYGCADLSSQGTSNDTQEKTETVTEKPVQYLTTMDRTSALTKTNLSLTDAPLFTECITLDKEKTYQDIDGFGAAMTGSTCYNLMKMSASDRHAFLKRTFSVEDGFGFSYVRISIGCSDFSLSEYTCCDTEGIENFSLTDEENKYVIPVLKEVLVINPELKIMGSPWTCPRWMKVYSLDNKLSYNSWTGGQLNPDYYEDYALYFVKWIQAFKANGIDIYSITLQNEPLHRGNSASMYMSWPEQRDFIKDAVGPAIQKAGLRTKIYAYDHNYNYADDPVQHEYPLKIYDDAAASLYLAGAAYHNYGGSSNELLSVQMKAPTKELVFSEASIGEWNDGHNIAKMLPQNMRDLGLGTINKWCRAVIVWNLMLDSERGPNRPAGCKTCYGAVDIDKSDYKTITYNSHYYMLAHLSTAARAGAKRIDCNGFSESGVTTGTFLNPDGSLGVVLLNENDRNYEISFTASGNTYLNCRVPAHSVITLRWKE